MLEKTRIILISLVLIIFTLTSCFNNDETQRASQSSKSVATTAESETSAESTQETTDIETTTDNSANTIPAPIFEGSSETVFFQDGELDLNVWSSSYLINAENAWIFDPDINDGLSVQEPFEAVELQAGTVIFDLAFSRPELDLFPGRTLFILADDRCVIFDQSISADGEVLFNGKPSDAFSRVMDSGYNYSTEEPITLRNYELLPNTPLDPSIRPQNISINVDWNGDGQIDIISRVCPDANNLAEQTVIFTDGASGERTDITDRLFSFSDLDINRYGLTDHVMLIQDSNSGQYVLIDTVDTSSADYSIFTYSYDPETIIKYEQIGGSFAYVDGKMYGDSGSFIFGNIGAMRTPLVFDGEHLEYDATVDEYWWMSAQVAKEQGTELPSYYTYTLVDVSAEKMTDEAYEPFEIPTGVAVFPQYYQWDEGKEDQSGYLYFLLADGSQGRIAFEWDEEGWSCSFGGVPQEELFYCMWGG